MTVNGTKMKVTAKLEKRITNAVRNSMLIEGYAPTQSQALKLKAKAIMEKQRVQVSVPNK